MKWYELKMILKRSKYCQLQVMARKLRLKSQGIRIRARGIKFDMGNCGPRYQRVAKIVYYKRINKGTTAFRIIFWNLPMRGNITAILRKVSSKKIFQFNIVWEIGMDFCMHTKKTLPLLCLRLERALESPYSLYKHLSRPSLGVHAWGT